MRTPKNFTSNFGMLAGISKLSLGVFLGLLPSCALDDGSASNDPAAGDDLTADGDEASSMPVCSTGPIRCHAHMRTAGSGTNRRVVSHAATPVGLGAPDLQSAYNIDPTKLATSTVPTIAIVDAFGYTKLEADLAVYRTQYGLPACTIANGCLKIVNQQGQTSPLPPNPPADDDWTIETALDVDMASAACPKCKILVVQATDNTGDGLYIAQNAAVALGATVISNSWGGPEVPNQATAYAQIDSTYLTHPGVAIFVAAGDAGYNNTVTTAGSPTGPDFPGTAAHTIAVGATRLVRNAANARGWSETAWALTAGQPNRGAGGSACSLSVPKPAYQTESPCAFKATADISAVGDPATGVAVYNTNGTNPVQWIPIGGTSASAPFVAAIFAATGNGAQTSGAFIKSNVAKLWDVIGGNNGTCPAGQGVLCTAGQGWDGPTGYGTPNVGALMPASAGGGGGGGGGGDGGGGGGGSGGTGSDGSNNSGDNGSDVTGGCSTGGTGAGLLLGVALLGLRRRRR